MCVYRYTREHAHYQFTFHTVLSAFFAAISEVL